MVRQNFFKAFELMNSCWFIGYGHVNSVFQVHETGVITILGLFTLYLVQSLWSNPSSYIRFTCQLYKRERGVLVIFGPVRPRAHNTTLIFSLSFEYLHILAVIYNRIFSVYFIYLFSCRKTC